MQALRHSFGLAFGARRALTATQIRWSSKISQLIPDYFGPPFRRCAESTQLPSGIRVSTFSIEATNAVSICLLVKTGSRYETEDVNGANFFLEKLAFTVR